VVGLLFPASVWWHARCCCGGLDWSRSRPFAGSAACTAGLAQYGSVCWPAIATGSQAGRGVWGGVAVRCCCGGDGVRSRWRSFGVLFLLTGGVVPPWRAERWLSNTKSVVQSTTSLTEPNLCQRCYRVLIYASIDTSACTSSNYRSLSESVIWNFDDSSMQQLVQYHVTCFDARLGTVE